MKITNDLYINNQQRDISSNGELGKDAFLKILMTQLQNQDPSNPLQDKDFVAQMATFSSLEQIQNLNTSMTSLLGQENQIKFTGYGQLIGKQMSWVEQVTGQDGQVTSNNKEGILQSIKMVNGVPQLVMNDGSVVQENMITNINSTNDNPFLEASYLIGKTVSWLKDGKEQTGVVQSVRNDNNDIKIRLDSNELIDMKDIQSIAQNTVPTP